MIEIIYKGEDDEKKEDVYVRLPKNVRQIGDSRTEEQKIYMEDFAMTYVKHFGGRNLKYGVLLGNVKHGNGNSYVFITGAVCAKPVLDNEIVFDEEVWTGIYEEIKMYFEDVEIVGWFVSMPGILENDMAQIQKIHLDNFAGSDRVCFIVDYMEGEDTFWTYGDGKMVEIKGHYIYYEKNADMQSYMIVKREDDVLLPQEYDQFKKKSITSKVHRIFFSDEQNNGLIVPNDKKNNISEGNDEGKLDKKIEKKARHLPAFAYSASSFMILAMLLGTIALMNASGKIEELKDVMAVMEKDTGETVKVVDVDGNTFPTTTPSPAETKENVTKKETEKTSETKSSETKEPETTTEPPTTKAPETTTEPPTTKEPETTATIENTEVDNTLKERYYVVKNGDSLYTISKKNYGNISMIDSIKKANNITNENYIKEGETILLP